MFDLTGRKQPQRDLIFLRAKRTGLHWWKT